MTSDIKGSSSAIPIGKKIERIRMYFGIKQETLAANLGITQQAVSHIEKQEIIEDSLLGQIAEALGVSTDIIKNFDEERAIYNINNNSINDSTFEEGATAIVQQFNPVEKIVELYERLLKSEREKIEILMNNKN